VLLISFLHTVCCLHFRCYVATLIRCCHTRCRYRCDFTLRCHVCTHVAVTFRYATLPAVLARILRLLHVVHTLPALRFVCDLVPTARLFPTPPRCCYLSLRCCLIDLILLPVRSIFLRCRCDFIYAILPRLSLRGSLLCTTVWLPLLIRGLHAHPLPPRRRLRLPAHTARCLPHLPVTPRVVTHARMLHATRLPTLFYTFASPPRVTRCVLPRFALTFCAVTGFAVRLDVRYRVGRSCVRIVCTFVALPWYVCIAPATCVARFVCCAISVTAVTLPFCGFWLLRLVGFAALRIGLLLHTTFCVCRLHAPRRIVATPPFYRHLPLLRAFCADRCTFRGCLLLTLPYVHFALPTPWSFLFRGCGYYVCAFTFVLRTPFVLHAFCVPARTPVRLRIHPVYRARHLFARIVPVYTPAFVFVWIWILFHGSFVDRCAFTAGAVALPCCVHRVTVHVYRSYDARYVRDRCVGFTSLRVLDRFPHGSSGRSRYRCVTLRCRCVAVCVHCVATRCLICAVAASFAAWMRSWIAFVYVMRVDSLPAVTLLPLRC